jgi:hypothetical protein
MVRHVSAAVQERQKTPERLAPVSAPEKVRRPPRLEPEIPKRIKFDGWLKWSVALLVVVVSIATAIVLVGGEGEQVVGQESYASLREAGATATVSAIPLSQESYASLREAGATATVSAMPVSQESYASLREAGAAPVEP